VSEYKARFYRDERGISEALDYYRAMPTKHRAKAAKWIKLLESEGPNLPRPYADIVSSPVRELRPKMAGLQHRFLYVIHGKTILLTGGLLKKSDQVPPVEIEKSKRRYADWLIRGSR